MFRHAPDQYTCPFCLALAGVENERVYTRQQEIVYRDERVAAWTSCHWYANNPGHVLVVPVRHIENIYEMPAELGGAVFDLSRRIAIAMKQALGCHGTSSRQHNEPAGYQDVWHFHQHVFPRWKNDNLYGSRGELADVSKRIRYAGLLREALTAVS